MKKNKSMSAKQKLVFEASNFADTKKKFYRHVESHYFNFAISITAPEAEQIPNDVEKLLRTQQYYIVKDLPIARLIDEEFIEGFVKKGSIYMLTHRQQIDTETCAALLPTGVLVLNATKDLYEQLGLEGQVSRFHSKTKMKYVIQIDLTLPHFKPGRKHFERVKWCLNERLDLKFDFLVAWLPQDETVCPSSIESYFRSSGLSVSLRDVTQVHYPLKLCPVPLLRSCSPDSTDEGCDFREAYEWLGVMACGCEFGEADDYVNSLVCPEPNLRRKVSHLKMRGFFAPQQILEVISHIRDWTKNCSLPWTAITIHGFMDSPVSWNETEHGYQFNGDNLYTFIVFPNDDYWLYSATGSHDIVS